MYMTPKETLKQFFKDSDVVQSQEKIIDQASSEALEKKLGYALERDAVTFYIGKTGEKIDGYALLDHQIGKSQPITFMTLINPQGQVEQVEVLVYRESQGAEVRYERFLKQYTDKMAQDSLKVGRDVTNISGATMSVRAVTLGVKRALILWNYFYGDKSD